MDITFLNSLQQIEKNDWQTLNTSKSPLLSYDFFHALEESRSVSAEQGWQPHHMVIKNDGIDDKKTVKAILPLYVKSHSWGEYVFDWSWAEAFEDHNIPYYPKLVGTIPFTPVTSNKLLGDISLATIAPLLSEHCQHHNIHSWHLLFCGEMKQNEPGSLPEEVYLRHTVQFTWFNQSYASFNDFLSYFTARKRKNTRKERLSIIEQGVSVRRVNGADITKKELDFFYLTYQLTYLKKGHQPHLSAKFFQDIIVNLANNILLVIASKGDEDIACALFFYDETHLYGRYWGCTEHVKNLHFELCYYQGIEFSIEHNLICFNPGTQGEHKIQRGFEPVLTHSYHWIKHKSFRVSIKDFCQRERDHMNEYLLHCKQALPFRDKKRKSPNSD
jgi:predicted N-acyltransferase